MKNPDIYRTDIELRLSDNPQPQRDLDLAQDELHRSWDTIYCPPPFNVFLFPVIVGRIDRDIQGEHEASIVLCSVDRTEALHHMSRTVAALDSLYPDICSVLKRVALLIDVLDYKYIHAVTLYANVNVTEWISLANCMHAALLVAGKSSIEDALGWNAEWVDEFVPALSNFYRLSAHEALIRASATGDRRRVARLVKNDPSILNPKDVGRLPLHKAIRHHQNEVAQWLIGAGADVNEWDECEGGTAFHVACTYANSFMATEVVRAGVDANQPCNTYGDTPLMIAAYDHKVELCRLLIGKGADVNVVGNEGQTALSYARQGGHQELCDMLMAAGATE